MSRSLHVPSVKREKEGGRLWKLLPLLAGALIIALIWAERRSGKRGNAAIGTAPAGAPPMQERDPSIPSAERFSPPSTTSGAMAGAGPSVGQPAPIAEADAPGTLPPEELATAGPDMEAWVSANVGDTDATGAVEEPAPTAAAPAGEPPANAASESDSVELPTPAAETTAVAANEGADWIQSNGSKTCPDEFPIKGNASSRIYHLPGESTYEATVPEICFATEEAAVGLGYRARKR